MNVGTMQNNKTHEMQTKGSYEGHRFLYNKI